MSLKNEKIIILIIGIILGLLSVIARLSVLGWLFMLGLITTGVFGLIHLFFLGKINNLFNRLNKKEKQMAWLGVIIFPLIFLFQFDFDDTPGSFYIYEYLTGEGDSGFKQYGFYLAIVAAIIYIANLIIWLRKIKRLKS